MKTLHIVRTVSDPLPMDLSRYRRETGAQTILFIQEGVYRTGPFPGKVFASRCDAEARGVLPPVPLLGDDEICRLIIEHDKTIIW